jgi:tryptophan halogenase
MAAAPIKKIVILGGGTAGWLAASMMVKVLGKTVDITLVESEEIGTVGVGEATIPPLINLLNFLGLDEAEVMRNVQGTYKLGVEFADWYEKGHTYRHMFGAPGNPLGVLPFYQYWLRQRAQGKGGSLWDYSLNEQAAKQNRFTHMKAIPDAPRMDGLNYALHFDAGLLARYLRGVCERSGVTRREGKVSAVNQNSETGFIESLTLASDETIEGEFFLDCSGFRGVLIEDALHAGYEEWTHWLPCDRAVAVPCATSGPLRLLTQTRARTAGWQWRIPLQHRIGNGHVFSSGFMEPDEATRILLDNLDGAPLAEPRHLRFVTGRRKTSWKKNCVALGLAAGFMEPIESTTIHMVQSALQRLLNLFPDTGFNQPEIDEYNRKTQREYELIRDFIILHYNATKRDDTPFWNYCRTMTVPDSLTTKIEYFRQHGRVIVEEDDLFKEANWIQVLIGQGIMPESFSPLALNVGDDDLDGYFDSLRQIYARTVAGMPTHDEFIARYCKAPAL